MSRSVIIVVRRNILMMLILCSVSLQQSVAQVVFWTEGFGSGCSQGQLAVNATFPNGTWTVDTPGINDPFANQWYISATEAGLPAGTCRDGCLTNVGLVNQTLHVGNVPGSTNSGVLCVPGDCGAFYDPGGVPFNQVTTHKIVQSPVIDCTGKFTISVGFNYFENGDFPNDNATFWYYNGTTWSQISDPPQTSLTNCTGQAGFWTAYTIALPASANNNPAVRIGFLWVNDDDATGSVTSFAVDNITLAHVPVPVVADFTVDTVSGGCAGSPRQFTDLSTGNPTGWAWGFPGGNPVFSSLQNPVVTYATAGTYSVTLAAYSASDSDTIIRTNYITIVSCVPPVANFVASDTVICQNNCINFTDLSSNVPTGWQWIFNGAIPSTSTLQNPSNICYPVSGTYSVQLTASNAGGSNSITKIITVDSCPPPIADFSQSSTGDCLRAPNYAVCIDFFDGSTSAGFPITSWSWSFPGAIPDTSSVKNPANICYTSEGLFDVILIVGNGNGFDTIIKYSTVNITGVTGATISGDTTMPAGDTTTLGATGGVTYYWYVPGVADSTKWGLDTNYVDTVVASPQYTTTYFVLITDATGCSTTRQVTVFITRVNRVFIPNAFSPFTGEGVNRIFKIYGNNIFSARLAVFDRWGEKVFESEDKDVGWDGRYKGEYLNAGVYTYYATIVFDEFGKLPQVETGTVALIR